MNFEWTVALVWLLHALTLISDIFTRLNLSLNHIYASDYGPISVYILQWSITPCTHELCLNFVVWMTTALTNLSHVHYTTQHELAMLIVSVLIRLAHKGQHGPLYCNREPYCAIKFTDPNNAPGERSPVQILSASNIQPIQCTDCQASNAIVPFADAQIKDSLNSIDFMAVPHNVLHAGNLVCANKPIDTYN